MYVYLFIYYLVASLFIYFFNVCFVLYRVVYSTPDTSVQLSGVLLHLRT